MSRPLRLEHSGAIWHVASRGDERRAIFRDDADRERFLAILGSVAIRRHASRGPKQVWWRATIEKSQPRERDGKISSR